MENVFRNIVADDEKIIYVNGTYVKGYVIKKLLIAAIPCFIFACFSIPIILDRANLGFSVLSFLPLIISTLVWFFLIFLFIRIAKNTYICITEKRIIKRFGFFNVRYEQYDIKNIGTIQVSQTVFDCKEEPHSGSLFITVRRFYTDFGSSTTYDFIFSTIYGAYEVQKILDKLTEENDDALNIEIKKDQQE